MTSGMGLRIRHGVAFDPLFGYRAVREVNGERTYIGPWTTEQRADAIAAEATAAMREAVASTGAPMTDGDTPLGIWTPT